MLIYGTPIYVQDRFCSICIWMYKMSHTRIGQNTHIEYRIYSNNIVHNPLKGLSKHLPMQFLKCHHLNFIYFWVNTAFIIASDHH